MGKGSGSIFHKLFRIDLMICDKITAQILIVHRNRNACKNAFKAVDHLFNLSKLDPQTAKLDLIVHSSKKFNLIIRIDLCKITGFICSLTIQFNKCYGCFFRQVHIASAHTQSCDHKLAGFSIRQNVVLFIYDKYADISIWNADRDLLAVRDYFHGTAYGRFGRAISVHNVSIRIYRTDFLIKGRWKGFRSDIEYPDLGHCILQLWQINDIGQIGRRRGHDINFIFNDQSTKDDRIVDLLFAGDNCSQSIGKRNEFFENGDIKSHGCHRKGDRTFVYISKCFRIFRIRIYKVCQIDVFDHNTLWLSCGSGSINTITKVMFFYVHIWIFRIFILKQLFQQQYFARKLCKQILSFFCNLLCRNDIWNLRIFKNILDPVIRVIRRSHRKGSP